MYKLNAIFALIAVVFIFFGSAAANAQEQQTDSVALYLEASTYENAGDFGKAAESIEKILKKEQSVHLYLKLGELYLAAGFPDKAFDTAQKAEKAFPKEQDFKFLLGQLYEFHKRNPAEAYKYYLAASKLSTDPKYRVAAARSAESLEDYGSALSLLTELIKANPNEAFFYSERGRIYQRSGKISESIKDLKKAVELSKDMPALLRLADIYLSMNDNENAKIILEQIAKESDSMVIPELKLGEIYRSEKDYTKAIELYSNVADKLTGKDRAAVLKQMATVQYETGDYDNASRTFEWVTELVPEDSMSAYVAGYIYEYLNKPEKAKAIYERALKIHPTYAHMLKRMAYMNLAANEPEKAAEFLNAIVDVERDVDYYLLMSEVHSIKKEHNKAVLVLLAGLNENPSDPGVLYYLAMQYELLQERQKAVDTIKSALKYAPDNSVFMNFLGYIYADMGINLDEAYDLISKALEKEPENPAYLDSLGWYYYRLNDYKKAYEYIERAINAMPGEKELEEHFDAVKSKLNTK